MDRREGVARTPNLQGEQRGANVLAKTRSPHACLRSGQSVAKTPASGLLKCSENPGIREATQLWRPRHRNASMGCQSTSENPRPVKARDPLDAAPTATHGAPRRSRAPPEPGALKRSTSSAEMSRRRHPWLPTTRRPPPNGEHHQVKPVLQRCLRKTVHPSRRPERPAAEIANRNGCTREGRGLPCPRTEQ